MFARWRIDWKFEIGNLKFCTMPKNNIFKSPFVYCVIITVITLTVFFFPQKLATASWFNTNWDYRKSIVVDGSQITGDLTDFPVLVSLASDASLQSNAQSDGDDILFVDESGTQLKHEIEKYDSSTGALTAWVKIPTLTTGNDVTIFMYYGNSSVSSQADPTNVWDSTFKGIWHMPNSASSLLDSTVNDKDGTALGSPTLTDSGKIAGGYTFTTNGNNIFVSSDTVVTDLTISAWVKVTAHEDWAGIAGIGNNLIGLTNDENQLRILTNNDASNFNQTVSTTDALPYDGAFHHVAADFENDKIYVDGADVTDATSVVAKDQSFTQDMGNAYNETSASNTPYNPESVNYTEYTSGQYSNILSNDSNRNEWHVVSKGDWSTTDVVNLWYKYKTAISSFYISSLNFSWIGYDTIPYPAKTDSDLDLWIWDTSTSAWNIWASDAVAQSSDQTYTSTKNPATNFVESDGDIHLATSGDVKSSCPFVFTNNGEEVEFISDAIPASVLGMWIKKLPMGLDLWKPNSPTNYLFIDGERLKAENGNLDVYISEQLQEIDYIDEATLIAVDHPKDHSVIATQSCKGEVNCSEEERYHPEVTAYKELTPIKSAHFTDLNTGERIEVTEAIREKDGVDMPITPDPIRGFANGPKGWELEMDLGEFPEKSKPSLVFNWWVKFNEAGELYKKADLEMAAEKDYVVKPSEVYVINEKGEWESIIPLSKAWGPDGLRKDATYNLYDKNGSLFKTNDHRIRLVSDAEIYIDKVGLALEKSDNYITTPIKPESANLRFHGWNTSTGKGGDLTFNFKEFTDKSHQEVISGDFTKYGDVSELLQETDDKQVIMNTGDTIDIKYSKDELPKLKEGWKRDYLLYIKGWFKQARPGSYSAYTVNPLPFYNMSGYPYVEKGQERKGLKKLLGLPEDAIRNLIGKASDSIGMNFYPYGKEESFPDDPEHQEYREEWNTRHIEREPVDETKLPEYSPERNRSYVEYLEKKNQNDQKYESTKDIKTLSRLSNGINIEKGDSIWSISEKYFLTTRLNEIAEKNIPREYWEYFRTKIADCVQDTIFENPEKYNLPGNFIANKLSEESLKNISWQSLFDDSVLRNEDKIRKFALNEDSGHHTLYDNYIQMDITLQAADKFYIGRNLIADPASSFNGTIDEVRLSDDARSAEWIETEYNNQSDPSSFITLGEESEDYIMKFRGNNIFRGNFIFR